jgi:transcriptional regulator with XRE-family HTH domain
MRRSWKCRRHCSAISSLEVDNLPSLGASIRALRQNAGLTGTELASRVGHKQSWISKVERGQVVPSAEDIEQLAKACGATELETAVLIEEAGRAKATARPRPNAKVRQEIIGRIEALLGQVVEEVRRLR